VGSGGGLKPVSVTLPRSFLCGGPHWSVTVSCLGSRGEALARDAAAGAAAVEAYLHASAMRMVLSYRAQVAPGSN
jgi:hypothetical protein